MNHSSETDIQQYALDKSASSRAAILHIESCGYCMTQVRNYQLIFSELKLEQKPAFDFDLAAMVMPQLPKSRTGLSPDQFIAGFLVVFVCCCVGLPVILFGQYILNMFSGIPPFFMYATLISAVIILIVKILTMYRKYQQQMQLLNFN